MKIVLLSTYFSPEISSVTHLFDDLTGDLALAGHEVTVVCNRANRGLTEEERAAYENRLDETLPNGVRILRVGPKGAEKGSLIRRGLRFLSATAAICRAAAKLSPDVYLVNSMPPYLGLAGARLAHKKPTLYILQDLFPDSVIQMGKLPKRGPVTGILRAMERKSLRSNTRLVTISDDMKKTLVNKGVMPERIDVIPNWADAETISPLPRKENALFHELGLDPVGFYAVYAGALGVLQTPDVLLNAAKLVKQQNPAVRFAVFGSGGLADALAARIAAESITNVSLFPAAPVSRVREVYNIGDVSLVTLKKNATSIAMPSKTWTAMAAGRPVIAACDKHSEYERRVLEASCTAVLPEDAKMLADAVLKAYEQRDTLDASGEKARAYVKEKLGRKASTAAYERALVKTAGFAVSPKEE